MAAQLFGSVKDSYNFLCDFVKLSQCSRRKRESTPTKTLIGSSRRSAEELTERNYDSDDTTMSTETGEFSNAEFSDKSNLSDGSIDGPGDQARPHPGLQVPPGLEGPWNAPVIGQGFHREFPSKSVQLRQSIRMLKGALEVWEADLSDASSPGAQQSPIVPLELSESSSLLALQEALGNLTPQGVATVKSLLACKTSLDITSTSVINPPVEQPRQLRLPARNHHGSVNTVHAQRPFAPFPGASAERVHVVNPSKVPRYTTPKNASLPDGACESLSSHLGDLLHLDSACVLMVRKINRLGLSASGPLEDYFSQFGKVERVMVAPTRSKAGQKVRVRASPQGFVVMSKAEEAQAALGCGVEHIVQGECICAYPFESRAANVTK